MYGTRAVEEICALTRCSRTSLLEGCRAYQQQELDGLHNGRLGGNSAKILDQAIFVHGVTLLPAARIQTRWPRPDCTALSCALEYTLAGSELGEPAA
jgi:hypothetical protein